MINNYCKGCFANSGEGNCMILKQCNNITSCNFYKTNSQLELETITTLTRLRTLSKGKQKAIKDLYYGNNKKVWQF